MFLEALAAGSLLAALGSSGSDDDKSAMARFLMETSWPPAGQKVRIWFDPKGMVGIGFWRFSIAGYGGDPDHAIEMVMGLGSPNRYIAEALLSGRIPHAIEADKNGEMTVVTYITPDPATLLKGWSPRPPIFYRLRNLALLWQNGMPFIGNAYNDPEVEEVQNKATWIVEWLRGQAKPTRKDTIEAVRHLEWLFSLEQNSLVDPDRLTFDHYQKTARPAKEAVAHLKRRGLK